MESSRQNLFANGDATFLMAFDVFVLPSRFEGFPYVLLEAAWARLPIIATNVGGVCEFIVNKKTGILIETDDVVGIVNVIDEFIAHPETTRLYADAANQLVTSDFSCVQMCEKTERVYIQFTLRL